MDEQAVHNLLTSPLVEESLKALVLGEQPWWVYAILLALPLFFLLALREFNCWFWKTSSIVNRLARLEKAILSLENQLKELPGSKVPPKDKQQKDSAVVSLRQRGPTEL